MSDVILASLISAIVGGVFVSVINFFFMKNKTNAEIAKLQVETEKLKSEPATFISELEERQQRRINTLESRLRADTEKQIKTFESQLQKKDMLDNTRWELKYQACLQSLNIVDGVFSHNAFFSDGFDASMLIVKQSISTEQARECVSKLMLTCINPNVAVKFMEVLMASKLTAPMIAEYRNLVREELWGENQVDKLFIPEETAWIASLKGDPKYDFIKWHKNSLMENSELSESHVECFVKISEVVDDAINLGTGDKADIKTDILEFIQEESREGNSDIYFMRRKLRNINRLAPKRIWQKIVEIIKSTNEIQPSTKELVDGLFLDNNSENKSAG